MCVSVRVLPVPCQSWLAFVMRASSFRFLLSTRHFWPRCWGVCVCAHAALVPGESCPGCAVWCSPRQCVSYAAALRPMPCCTGERNLSLCPALWCIGEENLSLSPVSWYTAEENLSFRPVLTCTGEGTLSLRPVLWFTGEGNLSFSPVQWFTGEGNLLLHP